MSTRPTGEGSREVRRNGPGAAAAGLHEAGDAWLLACVREGRARVERVARGDRAALARALADWGATRLVRVAPAGATIAKLVPAPAGSDEGVDAALSLLCEGELPRTIPEHRRAGGIVEGVSSRQALLTGWLPGESPARLAEQPIEETWTTVPSALACLHAERAGVSTIVEGDGTMVVFASGELGSRLRVVREDPGDADALARTRDGAAREAAGFCGVRAEGDGIDARVASALGTSVSLAGEQVRAYGVALGAALLGLGEAAAGGSDEGARGRGLAGLMADPPRDEAPALVRAARWLRVPRHAWLAAGAAAVLMIGWPWAVAQARLVVLGAKAGGTDQSSEREIRRQSALYRQMDESRWPMTKLLADVSAATPVGVVVESLRISREQGVAIQGTAPSLDVLNKLQQNLNRTGLFASVRIQRSEASASGVEFDVDAVVSQPHRLVAHAEDFAANPLRVRLYGEEARSAPSEVDRAGAEAPPDEAPGEAGERTRDASGDGDEGPARRTVGSSEARSTPRVASGEVPPPLSDEAIGAMDEATARSEWIARRTFPQRNPDTDQATKDRLSDEVRRLQEHRSKLSAARGGGGS